MVTWKTMPMELDAIIKKLPNKASHGHDEVSNTMMKESPGNVNCISTVSYFQSLHNGRKVSHTHKIGRSNTPLQREEYGPNGEL